MKPKEASAEYRSVKVPLSFNVSVTGHRQLCNSELYDPLLELIASLLAEIAKNCREHERSVNLRLNSAIAAGADQIAALAAGKANSGIISPSEQWSLQVVLPFERKSYQSLLYHGVTPDNGAHEKDEFLSLLDAASRVYELGDRRATASVKATKPSIEYWQNMRYRTLGELLARQADMMLALWDGKAGGRGGTSDVVAMTLLQRKPVLRINPATLEVSWLMPSDETVDPIALADNPNCGPSANFNHLFGEKGQITKLTKHLLCISAEESSSSPDNGEITSQSANSNLSECVDDRIDNNQQSDQQQAEQDSNTETPGLFSTAAAFFGSSHESEGAWIDKPQNCAAMEFENVLLNKLIKFNWIRDMVAAKSFPEKTGQTTRAIIYNQFVKFFTKNKISKNPEQLQSEGVSDSAHTDTDQTETVKTQSYALTTDYAAQDWRQHPFSSPHSTNKSTSPAQEDASRVIRNIEDRPELVNDVDKLLKPAMITTDAIATARGHTYRSSYVMNFLGGTLAVWIGLTGLLFSKQKHFFVLAEVLLLLLLIFLYFISQNRSWHLRWLTTRYITESLRAGRYLIWIGMGGRRTIKKDVPWGAWYTNAIMSTSPLANAKIQEEDLRFMADELRSHVHYQIQYHDDNRIKLRTLHHQLDRWGKGCLVLTIFVAVVFIACKLSPIADSVDWMKAPVTIFCAGLPALAGALMGIRFQGDFERFSERSKKTGKLLVDIDNRLKTFIDTSSEPSKQPLFEGLYRIIQDLSDIYENDLEDWRYVYSARPAPDAA